MDDVYTTQSLSLKNSWQTEARKMDFSKGTYFFKIKIGIVIEKKLFFRCKILESNEEWMHHTKIINYMSYDASDFYEIEK